MWIEPLGKYLIEAVHFLNRLFNIDLWCDTPIILSVLNLPALPALRCKFGIKNGFKINLAVYIPIAVTVSWLDSSQNIIQFIVKLTQGTFVAACSLWADKCQTKVSWIFPCLYDRLVKCRSYGFRKVIYGIDLSFKIVNLRFTVSCNHGICQSLRLLLVLLLLSLSKIVVIIGKQWNGRTNFTGFTDYIVVGIGKLFWIGINVITKHTEPTLDSAIVFNQCKFEGFL